MISYRLHKPSTAIGTPLLPKWPLLIPRRKTRSFCCGSTGVGKSTVGVALMEQYHWWYPRDRIIIVDTKGRFVPAHVDTDLVFPEGPMARNHGRIDGVVVNGQFLRRADAIMWPKETVFVIQDPEEALKFMARLYHDSDARSPVMVYFDESTEFFSATWIAPQVRRIVNGGREKGLGMFVISQGALGVHRDVLKNSERLYIMTMYNDRDRGRIVEVANVPNSRQFEEVIDRYWCHMIEQGHPKVYRFKVTI
jgi:Type IV secretion-system coupling protein DNA-binding domain